MKMVYLTVLVVGMVRMTKNLNLKFQNSKWGQRTVIDFDEPVTQLFVWTKYNPYKWQFWAKHEHWLCIGVGKKLYKMNPNTEEITEWKLPKVEL